MERKYVKKNGKKVLRMDYFDAFSALVEEYGDSFIGDDIKSLTVQDIVDEDISDIPMDEAMARLIKGMYDILENSYEWNDKDFPLRMRFVSNNEVEFYYKDE